MLKTRLKKVYERFLELPRPVVLAGMYLVGAMFIGACVLAFYLYGSALVRMLLGP
jgi:hypothetical protein